MVIDRSNYPAALLCFIVQSHAPVDTLRYKPSYYRQLQFLPSPSTVRMLYSSSDALCLYRLYYLGNSFLSGKQGVIFFSFMKGELSLTGRNVTYPLLLSISPTDVRRTVAM